MYGYPGFQNGGKGFYGQPHQGFMNPGYEHTSTPAGFGGYTGPSSQGRESTMAEYGRSTSSQSHLPPQPQHASSSFGNAGMTDYMSARQQQQHMAGLGSQGLGGAQVQQGSLTAEDTLKPFGDPKAPPGPSPNP